MCQLLRHIKEDIVSTLGEYDLELEGCISFLLLHNFVWSHRLATMPTGHLTGSVGQESRQGLAGSSESKHLAYSLTT